MNQKVVVGIIVVIALIISLAFPIMYSMNKKEKQSQVASTVTSAPQAMPVTTPPPQLSPPPAQTTAPPPPPPPPPPQPVKQEPLVWEGTYAPPPKSVPQYQQTNKGANASKNNGPDLTEETLVGTAWQVASPYGPVSVEFGPNGQAVAIHSMIGQIPASWRVQGNKVVAKASAMGQNITIDATIQGQNLVAQGQNIMRVR